MTDQTKPATTFPQALMRERARYQVSRSELARHVGVAEGVVKRWERGEAIPQPAQFKRLLTRLPRVGPYPPAWAVFGRDFVTGGGAEFTAEVEAVIALEKDKLDAEKPEAQEFGEGLLRVREENEVTQEELGELLGVTNQAIGQWERGLALPVKENLLKLFEVMPELRAGMETGAIRRPKWTQDISPPTGGRGFPRASTIDAALDMALAQSDEEAARPRRPRVGWSDRDFPASVEAGAHEHNYQDELWVDNAGVRKTGRKRCAVCGELAPEPVSATEVRTPKAEHQHVVRRCPCGGDVAPSTDAAKPWICATCLRLFYEAELVEQGAQPIAQTNTVTELAEQYGRARVRLAKARAEVDAANAALVAARADAEAAERESAYYLELLDVAVQEEVAGGKA